MARLHRPRPIDPAVAEWMYENSDGFSVSYDEPERVGRPDFTAIDATAARSAVLGRLGVTGAELRSACAHERRKTTRVGNSTAVAIPTGVLEHMGAARGDALDFTCQPDGSVTLRLAPAVDIPAVRERIRSAGVSPRLLARLFYVPKSTVQRIVEGSAQ